MVHRALVVGSVVLMLVFGYLVYFGPGPLLGVGTMVGYLLAAPSLMVLALGLTVLRARIPPRGSSQTMRDYWADRRHFGLALVVWVAAEQAVILGLVGWLLSGSLVALGAGLVAMAALILNGPVALASR
jgi:hypothetical protein